MASLAQRLRRVFFDQMAAWSLLFRRRDVAMTWYRRMLAQDPDDTLALASLGFQHAQAGEKRDALAMFDRVLAVKPDDADAWFNRGFLLQELNDHDGAIDALRKAIGHNPDHDRAHYGLALSLIATHRLEEAVAPLRKNTRLQPMSPYGWYQLARVAARPRSPRRDAEDPRSPDEVRAQGRPAARARDGAQGDDRIVAAATLLHRDRGRRRVFSSADALLCRARCRYTSPTPVRSTGSGGAANELHPITRARHFGVSGLPYGQCCPSGGAFHAVVRKASGSTGARTSR